MEGSKNVQNLPAFMYCADWHDSLVGLSWHLITSVIIMSVACSLYFGSQIISCLWFYSPLPLCLSTSYGALVCIWYLGHTFSLGFKTI